MDYKLNAILSRVEALTSDLETIRRETASLHEQAEEIKQEIKTLLDEFYKA